MDKHSGPLDSWSASAKQIICSIMCAGPADGFPGRLCKGGSCLSVSLFFKRLPLACGEVGQGLFRMGAAVGIHFACLGRGELELGEGGAGDLAFLVGLLGGAVGFVQCFRLGDEVGDLLSLGSGAEVDVVGNPELAGLLDEFAQGEGFFVVGDECHFTAADPSGFGGDNAFEGAEFGFPGPKAVAGEGGCFQVAGVRGKLCEPEGGGDRLFGCFQCLDHPQ